MHPYHVKHTDISDTSLAYVEAGEGQPLLFVHGSLGDYRNWRKQMEAMSGSYRTIAMSRRCHYPNPYDDGGNEYSAMYQADDIAEFIHALGIEGCHIAAASYGAFSTLHMVVKYPGLVKSLVLGEPPIIPWLHHLPGGEEEYQNLIENAWKPAKAAFERNELEAGVRSFLKGVTGRDAYSNAPEAARQAIMDNARGMQAEALSNNTFPVFSGEDLSKIDVPILLLTGEFSPRFFSIITDEMERCFPNTKRDLIPRTSHSLQTGNPEYYNKVVMEFLAGQG
jgi:pimeloyl-ACP methyl ester carboxylesterase